MDPNPYESPRSAAEWEVEAIDLPEREKLAALVRRYLAEEVTAFEFDLLLDEFRDSADSAVRFVIDHAWFYYDDCDDHLVVLSKRDWDFFQRLLLLLESDRRVETEGFPRWSMSQLVALAALVGFLVVAYHFGWGQHLLAFAIPFGVVSIGISAVRRRTPEVGPYDSIIFPFATFSDLKSTYDSVGFRKSRYPRHLELREIRSPIVSGLSQLQFYLMWLMLSPIVLCFQILPEVETKARVVGA